METKNNYKQRLPHTKEYRSVKSLIGIEISCNRMKDISQLYELDEYKKCYPWEKKFLRTKFKKFIVKIPKDKEKRRKKLLAEKQAQSKIIN